VGGRVTGEVAGRRRKMSTEGEREGRREEEDMWAAILTGACASRMRVAFLLGVYSLCPIRASRTGF
jgi:hypothetical protein